MKTALLLLGLVLLITALAAENDSLIYLRFADAAALDPGMSRDQYSGVVTSGIFEGLVRYDKQSREVKPWLARDWKMSPDGKKWVFYLRPGVRFHDGSAFDSRAVAYSFTTRIKQRHRYPKWNIFFPGMIGVTTPDKLTVEIELNKPFAPFLSALTDPVAFIVLPGACDGEEFRPVGTGPFRFVSWEKNKSIILDRNRHYWERSVKISRVILKVIENPGVRIEQLKSGQADVLAIRSADEYNQFLGVRDVKIITTPIQGTFFLAFNTRKAPFNRVEVRRAFTHLIDKPVMIKQVFQNFAMPATSPLPPHILGFNDRLPQPGFNLENARKLLAKAGYPNGFSCTILFLQGDVGEQKIVDIFARNAREIGIRVIKEPYPFETLFAKIKDRQHDMVIRGWVAGPDPDIFLYANFTLERGNLNWAYYQNPQLTSLLKQGREELDPVKRNIIYRKAQQIIYNQVPWIPLYHLNYMIVHRSDIDNLYFDSNSYITFKDAIKR